MKYLSICSGIEAASVAWHPLGWTPWAFAEIEPFPAAVLKHHYPHVPNLGDVTSWKEWPDAAFDVLVGGTPCQSFSVAGLRAGLADPRGNLALTYLAILDRYRPRWMVWENVPGVLSSDGGRDFGAFLGGLGQLGYGWSYRVLDAQYVRVDGFARAVPQRRRRVFVVGHSSDWRRAAAVLFERESLQGHPAPRRQSGQRTPDPIATSTASSCCAVDGCDRPIRKRGWCNTHYQRWRKHGEPGTTPVNEPGQSDADRFWKNVDKTDGCWTWTAALNEKGYGIFFSNELEGTMRAHRWSFEMIKGSIPDGLHLDHLCKNKKCVNPDHLEPVTPAENTRRYYEDGDRIAPTLASRPTGGDGLETDFDCDGGLIAETVRSHPRPGSNSVSNLTTVTARMVAFGEYEDDGTASTLKQRDYKDATDLVAHALRADGFDASEDGTGRGTPLVAHALTTRSAVEEDGTGRGTPIIPIDMRQALRAHTDYRPHGSGTGHGIGKEGDPAPTLGGVTHAVAYSAMPMNSGKDYVVRETDIAQPLMAAGPGMGDQGGDYVVQPIAPPIAASLTRGAESAGKGGYAGRRQEDDVNIVAFQSNAGSQGGDVYEGISPTLRVQKAGGGGMPAIAFDARQSDVCLYGDKTGPLDTDGLSIAVAYGLRSDANRSGEAKTPSVDAEGRARLRDPGFNVLEGLAPTLDSTQPHTVATGWAVRRLTPLECERLQGFPDGYTAVPYRGKPASDGPRYKSLGNSMAVNVMRWLGRRIEMVEAAQ